MGHETVSLTELNDLFERVRPPAVVQGLVLHGVYLQGHKQSACSSQPCALIRQGPTSNQVVPPEHVYIREGKGISKHVTSSISLCCTTVGFAKLKIQQLLHGGIGTLRDTYLPHAVKSHEKWCCCCHMGREIATSHVIRAICAAQTRVIVID